MAWRSTQISRRSSTQAYAPGDLLPSGTDCRIGEELTRAVVRAEGVSAPSPFHLENTAAFIHRMDPATLQSAAHAVARAIRVQIITPPGALTRSGQKQLVEDVTKILADTLKSMIDAEVLPQLSAVDVIERFLSSIRGYSMPRFVREDYLTSFEGDRSTRSAALVRTYPKDLAALAPHLASIAVLVAIVVGRNDPYGLARDAAVLRERLAHARLDVLEAGHCVWEERAPEFESIVTQWVRGGFHRPSRQAM
jgi:pimeloyl-ACP methyl ester carboxylesterase